MRLNVSYVSYIPSINKLLYHAVPDWINSSPNPNTINIELKRLSGRIRLVGKELLGDYLHSAEVSEDHRAIDIYVSRGVSSEAKKPDFRRFCGWIEIFDMETGLATRASIPRAN